MIGNSNRGWRTADGGRLRRIGRRLTGQTARRSATRNDRPGSPTNPASQGFTLLELLIVMSIIIILATVTLPQYQRMVLHAREAVLRDDLYQMRKSLDQYAADKGKLPQSLENLVEAGYIREVPIDPMTDQADWNQISGDDPNNKDGGSGIVDVKSSSPDLDSDGKAYSEW